MAIKFLSSENIAGDIDVTLSKNGITYLAVTNTNTGVSANARVQVVGESSQLDLIATSAGYTGVTGWADSGIVSTDSGASGGLKLNSQAGGIQLQSATTSYVTMSASGLVTFGANIDLPDGSATAPSISNTGDTNTGIYWPGDHQIGFAVNGSRKMYMTETKTFFQNQAQGVEINNGLNVIGQTETDTLLCSGISTLASSVAIGGSFSPDRTLDVRGTGLSIYGTGNNTELMLRGQVEGTGTVRNVGAFHLSIRSDVGGDNDDLKFLRFVTGTYSGIAMQIQNTTGNVGIGTDSPDYKLEVQGVISSADAGLQKATFGNVGADLVLTANADATNVTAKILFNSSGAGGGSVSEKMSIQGDGSVIIGSTTLGGNKTLKLLSADNAVNYDIDFQQNGTTNHGRIRYTEGAADLQFFPITGVNPNLTLKFNGNSYFQRGNVGIGTDSPGAKLDILGSGNTAINTKGNLFVSSGGTATQVAETGGQISFGSWLNGDLSQPYPLAAIRGVAESSTTNNNRGALIFGTMDSNTAVQERMRIDSSGNVGIGTTAPATPLTVAGNFLVRTTTADSYENRFQVVVGGAADAANVYVYDGGAAVKVRLNAAGDSYFTGGNVGIGTTTLSEKLHVSGGNVRIDSVNNANHLIIQNNATATSGVFEERIKFLGWNNNDQAAIIGIGNAYFGAPVNALAFQVSGVEAIRIKHGGNVGIGTDSPASSFGFSKTLEIQGAANAEINISQSDNSKDWSLGITDGANYQQTTSGQAYVWESGATQRMRILADGNVIIGTETSTACTLKVSSTKNGSESSPHFCITGTGYSALHWLDTNAYNIVTNSASRDIEIRANTNGVILTPGATAWASNSDIALKENINPLENVLDKIKDYKCVEYNLKNSPEDKKIGFIAQDWLNDFSAIINKDKNDMLSMKYTETIPVLLKAIQELKAEVEELKKQIN